MATYVADLLKNDRASYNQLIDLLRYLSAIDVDLRILSLLRSVFTKEGKQVPTVSFEHFGAELKSVFHQVDQRDEICRRITSYLQKQEGDC